MKKLLLVTAMLFLFTSEVYAYTILGFGTKSCGQYVLDYEKASAPFDANDPASPYRSNAYDSETSWVLGFMSGNNAATGKNLGESTDTAAINLWLINYCKANPLKAIAAAAEALIIELDK